MSSAATPSEVKREQDGDETVVVDPLLHRSGGGTNSNHPMTPPDHQNDVIMKVRILSFSSVICTIDILKGILNYTSCLRLYWARTKCLQSLVEQDPGRAKQNNIARAGTNFTKPSFGT